MRRAPEVESKSFCADCRFSDGDLCSKTGYRKTYERKYGDNDFCGPRGQWFEPKDKSHATS